MSDKVKLHRETIEAIEEVLTLDLTKPSELIRDHMLSSGFAKSDGHLRIIGKLDIDTLIRALYIGYEVEGTPEDKVRTYYEKCTAEGHEWERTHPHANSANPYFTEMQGIAKTLWILNIKIEGVNA